MKELVTINYNTSKGNQYLYDDASGGFFVWSELKNKILKLYKDNSRQQVISILMKHYSIQEIETEYDLIQKSVESGCFYRETELSNKMTFSIEDIKNFIESNSHVLLLSVTDSCNLRCKYCIYSEAYQLTKNKSDKKMTINIAIKAVDTYLQIIQKEMISNPIKKFYISFYGGEPLLNFPLITKVIDYVNKIHPNRFEYNITTNGILLKQPQVNELIKRNVNILVSLDGPREEHDRLRVDISKNGSYDKIIHNLNFIREYDYEFFKNKVSIAAVYDYGTDIISCAEYFKSQTDKGEMPPIRYVNRVSSNNTNYYNSFSRENVIEFEKKLHLAEQNFIDDSSPYLNALIGSLYLLITLRKRIADIMPADMPTGGSCIPGQKIYVDTDGTFYSCERVGVHNPIGDIYNGLNYENIFKLIREYKKEIMPHCISCPVSRICTNCMSTFDNEKGFEYKAGVCADTRVSIKKLLIKYSELLEDKPDFSYINDALVQVL